MARWQYPGLVEPPAEPTGAGETIFPDKWWRRASEPVRVIPPKRHAPDAVAPLEPSLVVAPPGLSWWRPTVSVPDRHPPRPHGGQAIAPDPASLAQSFVTVDQWWRPASERLHAHPPRIPGGSSPMPDPAALSQSVVTVDMWWRDVVRVTPARPPRPHGGIAPAPDPASLSASQVDVSMWAPGAGDPTRRPAQVLPGMVAAPDWSSFVGVAETITLDKWFRSAERPALPRPATTPPTWVGVVETTLFEAPLGVSWWRPASEPVRVVQPRIPGGRSPAPSATVLAQSAVTVDMWWVPASERVHGHKPRPHGGTVAPDWSSFVTAETITPDKWWREAVRVPDRMPPRIPGGSAPMPSASVLGQSSVTVDMWWRPASERVHGPLPRPQGGLAPSPDPAALAQFAVTVDQWWKQSSERVYGHPPRPRGGIAPAPDPAPLSQYAATVDQWWRQPSERVHGPKPRPQGGISPAPNAATLAQSAVTADEWWRPTQTPRFERAPLLFLGLGVRSPEPSTVVAPPALSWWRPASAPLFVAPRIFPQPGEAFVPASVATVYDYTGTGGMVFGGGAVYDFRDGSLAGLTFLAGGSMEPDDGATDYLAWDRTVRATLQKARRVSGPLERPRKLVRGDVAFSSHHVSVAKHRNITAREASASGGAYVSSDRIWLIPARVLSPRFTITPGDWIRERDGTRWVVLEVQRNRHGQTWRLTTRNLAVVHDLCDRVTVERATVTQDAAGAPVLTFPPHGGEIVVKDAVCRVQPVSNRTARERAVEGRETRYEIIFESDPCIDAPNDRILWRGAYLDIEEVTQAESITELPRVTAVFRP